MASQSRIYEKPALNLEGQLCLLKDKGLKVPDPDRTLHYLRFIGYHRLSSYFPPFQRHTSKHFRSGTSFDQILNFYIFDRQLRLLVMDAVERIEVAVRSTISNTISEQHGPHWYLEAELFIKKYRHNQLLAMVKRATGYQNPKNQSESSKHYFRKYTKPHLPPSWMIAEELSVGTWSNIYQNLKSRNLQKQISKPYNLHYSILASWLHSFTYLRNLCAHHARMWNRKFTIKPKVAKQYKKYLTNDSSFFAQAATLNVFLSIIADGSHWQERLFDLLCENADIPIEQMGFYENWHEDSFWGIKK